MILRRWAFAALLLACAAAGSAARLAAQIAQIKVIGYFTEGGAASGRYTLRDAARSGVAARLTQLNYAFGRVADNRCQLGNEEAAIRHAYSPDESVDGSGDNDGSSDPPGQNVLRGTFHQLQELKRQFPRLRVVISFGGWDQSGGFSSAAQPENVREFVRSCVDMFIQGNFAPGIRAPGIFDGIDIDWEYPAVGGGGPGVAADSRNFTAMLAEFRRQLDALRPGLLLTAALPAEAELYEQLELRQISRYLDQLSIMAYDEHWTSEPLTNFHSALFRDPADPSVPPLDKRYGDYAVRGFVAAGVPRKKIIFGVPFYGKGWSGVPQVNHGLYQPATGPAPSIGYRDIKALTNADVQYHPKTATCSVWANGSFWGFDCPQALRAKMDYVRRRHLGGVMFWEMSHDTADLELLRILAGPDRLKTVTETRGRK
jgi:chitinase